MGVGVAEAVPGVSLPKAVAENAFQVEGLLAEGESALVVAQVGAVPADQVKRPGFRRRGARLAGQSQRLLGVAEGFVVAAPVPVGPGGVTVDPGLAVTVTEVAVPAGGLGGL